ncbi:unnamed protein product [Spirodela intermedia]|uniref:Beta-carotene isomerase D27-like C-terminal domain-containing protein n=1 Tax=Spirodela intermedia TaxID=51605 RepID=A0A7I8IN82_SPIIN|nr:unnamed protein product [Spirodela intermedia]CAA6658608.1 unnamed protein product [Spirodela intermedia]
MLWTYLDTDSHILILQIRTLLPHSKFTRECFALFTIIFCSWLIGPCEVKESSVDGRKEKNVVHIQKCRFLEGTNCVGMCLNLCKIPSQTYINDSLGVPVYMIPNFEDMSCEMVYGQQPPQEIEDPTLNQQCYHSLCKVKDSYDIDCCSP